jgi:hypothetical protein
MSKYPGIESSEYRIVNGVQYFVRKYGVGGVVFEEELFPTPQEKITRVYKLDGTIDTMLGGVSKS